MGGFTTPIPAITITASTGAVIDISAFVREHNLRRGRQHELDRTESSLLELVLNNRDGRFYPWNAQTYTWAVAGGGTTSLASNQVVRLDAAGSMSAAWSGTTYSLFTGNIATIAPSDPDALNSDVHVELYDNLRDWAQDRLSSTTLYPTTAVDWNGRYMGASDLWRCQDNPTINGNTQLSPGGSIGYYIGANTTVTPASSTALVFRVANDLTASALRSVYPKTGGTFTYVTAAGVSFNIAYSSWLMASTTNGGTLTMNGCRTTSGTLNASGTALSTSLPAYDYFQGNIGNATVYGSPSFNSTGVEAYDPNCKAIDLSGGTGASQAFIGTNQYPTSTYAYSQECWVKGLSSASNYTGAPSAGDTIMSVALSTSDVTSGNLWNQILKINSLGQLQLVRRQFTAGSVTTTNNTVFTNTNLNDGNWHLVTWSLVLSGTNMLAYVWLDGQFQGLATLTAETFNSLTPVFAWGGCLNGSNRTNYLPSVQSVGQFTELAVVNDHVIFNSLHRYPVWAQNSSLRYAIGMLTKAPLSSAQAISTPTLSKTTPQEVQIDNPIGFNPMGGTAVIGNAQQPITYTYLRTTLAGSTYAYYLEGVLLAPTANVATYNLSTPAFATVQTRDPKFTGQMIGELVTIYTGKLPASTPNVSSATGVYTTLGTWGIGTVPVTKNPTTTSTLSLLDGILQLSETENGFFFIDGTGAARFLNRFYPQSNAQKTAQLTDSGTSNTNAYYMPGPQIQIDDLDWWPTSQISSLTGYTAISGQNGRTYSRGSNWGARTQDQDALAQSITYRYNTSKTRVRGLVLSSSYQSPNGSQPNQAIMLGSELWDQYVVNRTTYGTTYNTPMVIEGIQHAWRADPNEWTTTFVLSPYEMNGSSTIDNGSFFKLGASTFQVVAGTVAFAKSVPGGAPTAGSTLQLWPHFVPGTWQPSTLIDFPNTSFTYLDANYSAYIQTSGAVIPQTSCTNAVTITTTSSVSLTLNSVSNFDPSGGVFFLNKPGSGGTGRQTWWPCTYTSVSGSNLLGCKLLNSTVGTTITTSSGNSVWGPACLQNPYFISLSTVTVPVGDTISSVANQDVFGG